MFSFSTEQLALEWRGLLQRFPLDLVERVGGLAIRHQVALADHFYACLLSDAAASKLISHEQVKTQLHSSLCGWIAKVFAARDGDDLKPLVAQQKHVGQVHARIDVPIHLVLRGARHLKERFAQFVHDDGAFSEAEQLEAARLIQLVVDLTMEIMGQTYSSSHDRYSRTQEAYRLFAVVQNVATERQRQRAALLDWENKLMFDLAVGQTAALLPRIGASEFGLWFRHKGAHAFGGMDEVAEILKSMRTIDEVLIPGFSREDATPLERSTRLRELRSLAQAIGLGLEAMFRQTNELEAGRDALTRLLNRKFLPVVLSKELAYARQHDTNFAVLALDVDHFKSINDTHGHEAGDLVLQQLAVLLSNNSRAGDYIFRLGGEEFMLLLVDLDKEAALRVAENMRQVVENEQFDLPGEHKLSLTLSIGVAMYDGHPDYQHVMRRADRALYRAKQGGRNRVAAARD
ncbi:diguanylate cyclase [Pusillimonas caeni]|uniref:GGDEF domain-containing protein n=1 Tax=Pusillimonas caeni TaxID=1348472 RepID=UPI000E59A901|nr:GGDEF domain-containing protein [Pusillimonas caeni]TFL13414.1 diguanylate cyclase [Pusillimonas caeni]